MINMLDAVFIYRGSTQKAKYMYAGSTLSADERGIGGYGIFIVKKVMDDISYEYKDGRNIFTMKKNY